VKNVNRRRVPVRADRLLSILMILQARGTVTAQQLAGELEVSVRTIYRDMDALSAAGVPVYAERGPGGGCSLIDSYRTTLTGLTRDEVRALFMLSIPAPLAELGVDQELKAALLKLSAALPDSRRLDQVHVRQRVHLDPAGWSEAVEPVPHLRTVQRAVWEDRKLHLTYRLPFQAQAQWLVEPYGLVAKAGTWYLVCARNGSMRTLRVSNVVDARIADQKSERPEDFNLAFFWQEWCRGEEQNQPSYPVVARVAPELTPWLPQFFGESIREQIHAAGPLDTDGWFTLTLPFESLDEARRRILGFGRAVEVLEPVALRNTVVDFARQIVELYAE
jgi:predicted DNA-binding transcriptional regulator YafY